MPAAVSAVLCFNSSRCRYALKLIEWIVMHKFLLSVIDDTISCCILNMYLISAKTLCKFNFSYTSFVEEAVRMELLDNFGVICDG